MNRLREGLHALWQATLALWDRATNGSATRQRTFAVGGAVLALLIIGGVVFAAMAPDPAPQRVAQRAQPTATATDTVTPSPTAKPTAKPTARPAVKPVPTLPPPPPVPTQPPKPPTPKPSSSGTIVIGDSMFSQFCSTPSSATPTPTLPGGSSSGTPIPTATPSCVPCPYYANNNPSQSQIATALANAAAKYGLPVNLLKAVAWQESKWHEDVFSCDGGIGLMQVQYYVYPWLNSVSIPSAVGCSGVVQTSDDPYSLQGNADLGAKYLKYLYCYYSFWGSYNYDKFGNVHNLSNPSMYTADWYYQQAKLPYPDSSLPNSLCAAVFNQNNYYPALPSTTSQPWPCPFSATAGDTTLLDITISAYNEGPGAINQYGINNMSYYVIPVESYIPQFQSGALP